MDTNYNPFLNYDKQTVIGELKTAGSKDPDVLYARKKTLLSYGNAKALAVFIPLTTATVPYDWKTLASIQDVVQWNADGPRRSDRTILGDPNPYSQSASASYAGRQYTPLASGTQTQVLMIQFEESRLHPAGENVLNVLRADGFTVQLVRCGPVYTESTLNYYRVTSARTKPVVLRQSIRRDGSQFQDSYDLRLDNTLPQRDPRDRDPGVSGCQ